MTVAAAAPGCPRCGSPLVSSQEYCLECGLRRPGPGRFGVLPVEGRRVGPRILGLAAVALAGAAVAVYATREPATSAAVETATGGSVTLATPSPAEQPRKALAVWPPGAEGWTIVIVSVPKVQGRQDAVDVASAARARGLVQVGVLDSSRFASLHPGYWIVFSDRYDTEAEATSALLRARTFAKSARVQRIAG